MNKMNMLFVAVILFFGSNMVYAQAYEGMGDQKVQVGFSPYGNGSGITGTYDYGIHEYFSVGGGGEFYFGNDGDDDPNFYIFGRANAHLGELINLPSNMDLYPGIDVGILGDDVGFGGHLGFRYFFQDNLGAYIELGSRGSLGLVINL